MMSSQLIVVQKNKTLANLSVDASRGVTVRSYDQYPWLAAMKAR